MNVLDAMPAAIANGMRAALFYNITLHKRASGYDADGVPNGAFSDTTLSGLVDTYSAYRRQEQAIPDTDSKILVLQYQAGATPAVGDEVTAKGQRYTIMAVSQDPAAATWELQARRK